MATHTHAISRPIGGYDRTFYTGMAIVAAVTVFIGFAPTFFLRARYQSTPLEAYLVVHGVLFTTWIALFMAQTLLVASRRIDVHRRLGWATAALAVLMVIVGTTAGMLSGRRNIAAGMGDPALSFLTTPLFSMAAFAALVAAAVWFRTEPQTHKRLMLLATISILDAAVARLPFETLQTSNWAYIPVTDLFIVAAVAYDRLSRGRINPAYVWGGLFIVVEQLLRMPIGETAVWKAFARLLIG